MDVVAVIPSRYGSTRFQGKPLTLIAGKPMIVRVYEQALKSNLIREVVVATDDTRIFDLVTSCGGHAVMTSAHHRSGTDRIAEAVESMNLRDDDIVINIQGDQPYYPPEILDQAARPLIESPDLLMATLVNKMTNPEEINHPNFVKTVMDNDGFALYFSRSVIPYNRDQNGESTFWKHLGFYSYRCSFLKKVADLPTGTLEDAEKLEQLRVLEHGYRIKVIKTQYDSIEVDTLDDARRVEEIIKKSGADEITAVTDQ